VKKKNDLPNHQCTKTSGSGGAKKNDDSSSSKRSVSLDCYRDLDWKIEGKKRRKEKWSRFMTCYKTTTA